MSEPIPAWQCIGCGRIEAPQNCIGICQDRRVEFVYAADHAEAKRRLVHVLEQRDALAALARRLAWSHPLTDGWERSYRALQSQARVVLANLHRAGAASESHAEAP